jgi:aspartate racemase
MTGAERGAEQRWHALRSLLRARAHDPPLEPLPRTGELPASFVQEGLWFLDRLQPNSTAYTLAVACRLEGPLDVGALEWSLTEIVRRHEILRTTLRLVNGELVQHIAPAPVVTVPVEEVRGLDVEQWAVERAGEPFDLERGPLFRARLASVAERSHCLLLTQHHAVFDAWSFEIFMRELCALYQAARQGRVARLGAITLQYADFATWERRRIAGETRDRLLDYWTKRLRGDLPTLRLPTDHPREPGLNRRGASRAIALPSDLGDALTSLATREGATLYMVLLAAFKTLLYRYTGEEDVIVGSPVANRNRVELEGMLGMLTNTLPLRTDLGGEPTFRQLLARVCETVTGALAHQDLPFELLVKAVRSHRLASSPLFRVMFAFQNVPRSGWTWPGLSATAWNVEPGRAKFDLTLTMQQNIDGLSVLLEYDADLFAAPTIARMLGHLVTLLGGIVGNPDRRITELPLLEALERQQLLTGWNGTGRWIPTDPAIHRVFEAHVRRAPGATAVMGEAETLSYEELNRRANRLAWRLANMELGPEALVGVCLDRSPSLIVAQLAILKAGAAYVPVAPSTPAPRIARLLQDVAAVVTAAASDALVSGLGVPRICIDDPRVHDERDDNLQGDWSSHGLAYVMFTSGSTGTPRGVCIPHRAVVHLVRGTDYARLTPDDVFLQLAPIAFDASTFEIWGALLNGARLVVAPAHRLSVTEIGALIARHRVTTLWLTSGLFELFVDGGLEQLASVRQLLTGGDVMSVPHAERFLRQMNGCRLINCYGPTENTTFTTTHLVEHVERGCSIPIGRPIAHTQVYLLDAHLQPVPIGVAGEAYVSGEGLARGYLNDHEATRARFIASPFTEGEVLYKTGDRARRRADGTLEFIGRADDQIKIRGFRVEPAEVEGMLRECRGVSRVAVRAERAAGNRRLIAYVVPREPDDELGARLRRFLRARLPDYMVPADFVLLPELPITDTGKRDRGALPTAGKPAIAPVPPRDALEQTLATLFEKRLGVEAVGIHDNFFDAGGDSLSAIAIGAEIERETGKALPLVTLFEKPTIAELAEEIRDRSTTPVALGRYVVPIKEGRAGRPLFLVAGGHGGKAEITICAKLVSRLSPAEKVFGLLAPAGRQAVEEIAAEHVASIRRLQPHGPYRIGGECIGGVVAYEIAQQLRVRGEEIDLLLLLDTWCPTTVGVIHHNFIGQPLARLKAGVSFLAGLPRRARHSEPWLSEIWRRSIAPPDARRHIRACMRYRPAGYPGRVTILASEGNLRRGLSNGWKALAAGGLVVHRAPGDHESYSRKYVQQTAEQLRICLEAHLEREVEHEFTDRS